MTDKTMVVDTLVGYYVPAAKATPEEISHVKSVLTQLSAQ